MKLNEEVRQELLNHTKNYGFETLRELSTEATNGQLIMILQDYIAIKLFEKQKQVDDFCNGLESQQRAV